MTAGSAIKTALGQSTLFGHLSPEALEAVAAIAREVTLPAWTILSRVGDKGKDCSVIVSGRLKLFRPGKSGAEHELFSLGPGQSLGEVNLLSEEPSPVSVKALEETRLILISREQFAPLLKDYPEVSAAVGQGVSQWLHRASANIESLTARRPRVPSLTWFDFAPLILLSLLCALAFNFSNPRGIPLIPQSISNETLTWISPSAAFEKYKRGRALFIDALPSAFHEEEHISNDLSLPLAIFDFIYDMKLGKMDKETEIIVYGRTISKHYDQEVAAKLTARGFRNVKILKGGLKAWKKNNYPVVS